MSGAPDPLYCKNRPSSKAGLENSEFLPGCQGFSDITQIRYLNRIIRSQEQLSYMTCFQSKSIYNEVGTTNGHFDNISCAGVFAAAPFVTPAFSSFCGGL